MIKIKPIKNKNIIRILMLAVFLVGILFVMYYNFIIRKPLKGNASLVSIEVKTGDGFYDILNRLDKENKLRSRLMIKLNLVLNNKKINLNEGIYEMPSDSTLNDILKSLENNLDNINLVKVTIPEGYNVEEIGEKLEENGFCSKDEFITAINNYELPDFVEEKNKTRYNLEGFLYPDTYLIKKGTNVEEIITIMLERFKSVMNEAGKDVDMSLDDKEMYDIVTIASMIEKEARVDKDRSLIASVIYNRLNKDMKLQLDATVLYSLGYHVETVLNRHLEFDSPYNTYKYKGLPEGPICNPGIESIKAAMEPAKSNYIYYVLQNNGSHYFTDSYDDFLNKKKELGY
ncbi:MAG: endolytic transglycosylase MltG [Clostridium butyricum]|nr:endolytic transglycosylase MltG [Clostridium butyricum]